MNTSEKSGAGSELSSLLKPWCQTYAGDPVDYEVAGSEAIQAIAVRHSDFREEPGNWPKIFYPLHPVAKPLVLIHGLKDSPRYLEDVAVRFAVERRIPVILPLLSAHGRKDPVLHMRRASSDSWRRVVDQSVEMAAKLGDEVSIGGLSTGGLLALDKAARDPAAVSGKVFLLSAALGLPRHQHLVLSLPALVRLADAWMERKPNNGLGGNPYKYSRTFLNGGRQVHRILRDLATTMQSRSKRQRELKRRVFVAHSEADHTIPIAFTEPWIHSGDLGQHHIISKARNVDHAELVLAEPILYKQRWSDEPPPPKANPEFEAMVNKALAFFDR